MNYILEGSVQKYQNQVRITTQLIQADPEQHLWSENYDKLLENIFELQTEIAQKVAVALKAELSPREQQLITTAPTNNLTAYEFYLQAEANLGNWYDTREQRFWDNAMKLYQEALDLDPGYAQIYADIGWAWWSNTVWTESYVQKDWMDTLFFLSNRAIELEPDLSDALALQGWAHFMNGDHQEAIDKLKEALEVNPNDATIYMRLGGILDILSRFEQSQMHFIKALELEKGEYCHTF